MMNMTPVWKSFIALWVTTAVLGLYERDSPLVLLAFAGYLHAGYMLWRAR